MHFALRPYAEPPRLFFRFFGLGLTAGLLVCSFVALQIAASDSESSRTAETNEGHAQLSRAHADVNRYAYEAFPSWAVEHPDLACPASRELLDTYLGGTTSRVDQRDTKDVWGSEYQWSCGTYGGRTQFNVWSIGEDQILGSPDDVRSY